jgi:hypothetical protein
VQEFLTAAFTTGITVIISRSRPSCRDGFENPSCTWQVGKVPWQLIVLGSCHGVQRALMGNWQSGKNQEQGFRAMQIGHLCRVTPHTCWRRGHSYRKEKAGVASTRARDEWNITFRSFLPKSSKDMFHSVSFGPRKSSNMIAYLWSVVNRLFLLKGLTHIIDMLSIVMNPPGSLLSFKNLTNPSCADGIDQSSI